jgi:hypothetical protein
LLLAELYSGFGYRMDQPLMKTGGDRGRIGALFEIMQ